MAQEIVRIRFDEESRRKLRFRHKDLRDAQKASGQSIGEMFGDPFGGWPYLLMYGMRAFDLQITLDKCSDLIDVWVDQPDPETKKERTLDELGRKLIEALNASKFVTVKAEAGDKDDEPEGNAKPEAD